MDSLAAFAMGDANRGRSQRVFDWDEAARRIRNSGATEASAGLSGDWEWTGGRILSDGLPVPLHDTYTFLASTWATPQLALGEDGDIQACWCWADDCDWNANTYWPQSALDILGAVGAEPVRLELES